MWQRTFARQRTFASQAKFEKFGRKSRRELFHEMELVVPSSGLLALVRPHYAVASHRRQSGGP